ncbi:uncharacterized protein LOC129217654 [Uloborus diversus]|uniref:uncharacterized protein LOC129217654 n=1 Tax=Uloborus diversus TaxID=327109 RepID=UPI00240A7CEF|nr:uncharacterized protein LOC129217654 [Uloborus diversus]
MEKRKHCLLKWSLVAIAVLAMTDSLFIPLVVYRICYQSTSQFVPSQCVNCPFLALQGYSFSCFGNTAFPRNMTPSQAQCMIQRCQQGVTQTPIYLGRKKRDEETEIASDESARYTPKPKNISSEQIQVVGEVEVFVNEDFDYEEMF